MTTRQNLELLEAMLLPRGYHVISARNGVEALERVASHAPDLIVLDVMMPRMDGFEVTRHLRERPESAAMPDPDADGAARSHRQGARPGGGR